MSVWNGLVKHVFSWVDEYGWSVPVLLFGILLGMSMAALLDTSSHWFEVVTALGTLLAAFAAFWSVNFSRRVQQRRDKQEDEARKPSLQITNVERLLDVPSQYVTPCHYKFTFVNLSQQAIFVTGMYKLGDATMGSIAVSYLDRVDVIIPPYGLAEYYSLDLMDIFHIKKVGHYQLFFYFNYAMRGSLFYRLVLPMRVRKIEQEHPKVKAIVFEEGEQFIEGPLEEPSSGVKAIHMFVSDDD